MKVYALLKRGQNMYDGKTMNGDKTDLNKGESCFFDALHNNRTDPPRSHKVELSKLLKKLTLMPSIVMVKR